MTTDGRGSLEQALAKTQAAADAALSAAGAVGRTLKKFRKASSEGNLRDVRATLEAAEHSMKTLRQEFANAKESWDFDAEDYLSNGQFAQELLRTAQAMGVRLFEQDDRLYCYPALIRIDPKERAVLIDKTRERRLRPSVLVAHFRDLQKRPPRFRPEAFLESLFEAYSAIAERQGKDLFGSGSGVVVRLTDVYDLLTLLPGQSREYPKQEFARDVYLLDQSDAATTKKGYRVSFPASTGTRSASATLRVITQRGGEKVYYGIAFRRGG